MKREQRSKAAEGKKHVGGQKVEPSIPTKKLTKEDVWKSSYFFGLASFRCL